MIHLYAIYPLDKDLISQPLSIEVESQISAIAAFRTEASANLFIQEQLNGGDFKIASLTLAEFDKVRVGAQRSLGVETYIKVFD